MVHQVKSSVKNISRGPKIVAERPKLAILLGEIVGAWGFLERGLAILYSALLGTRIDLPNELGIKPIDPLGFQIFDILETQRHRINLLIKIADWQLRDHPDEIKKLNDIVIRAVDSARKLRNPIIHAVWGIADEYPDDLIKIPSFGPCEVYTESDFNEALQRIIDAWSAVGKFTLEVDHIFTGA